MSKLKYTILKKILISLIVLILINWISGIQYARFDLTEEKRYTLTPATEKFISEMQDTIRFSVYLDGELPISFTKMKRDVSDLLNEFKRIGGAHIQIMFIDPASLGEGEKSLQNTYKRLMQYGLKPYTIQEEDETGKMEQQYIIPGIVISTSQRYVPVNLLSTAIGSTTEEQIYSALQQMEYQCMKSMKQLTAKTHTNIAFLIDQKELDFPYVYDATLSLMEGYNVDRISTKNLLDSMAKYKVLIIAKPQTPFTERDKYIIDQFVMHGGNILYAGESMSVDPDSLKIQSNIMAYGLDLNNIDLLFNWGVRINYDVILDLNCASIPINLNDPGMQPRFEPAPWYYYSLTRPTKQGHLITKNIDVVKTEFASTLDTVEGNGSIKKSILLTSSAFAQSLALPVPVGFGILNIAPSEDNFRKAYIPTSVLLEGQINSLYANRQSIIPFNELPKNFTQLKSSKASKIIVVSDGDVFKNEIEVNGTDTLPKPMQFYKYFAIDKREYTGNKTFFLNAVNYLCDDEELLTIRSRELKIRLLNKVRIVEEKQYWQFFNIVIPIIILGVGGAVVLFIRKRKYSKKYVG